jgi:hypothetical protein
VYQEKIVDAYTIEEAKKMILENDGQHSDEWVVEDVSFQEFKNVKHLRVLEESDAV